MKEDKIVYPILPNLLPIDVGLDSFMVELQKLRHASYENQKRHFNYDHSKISSFTASQVKRTGVRKCQFRQKNRIENCLIVVIFQYSHDNQNLLLNDVQKHTLKQYRNTDAEDLQLSVLIARQHTVDDINTTNEDRVNDTYPKDIIN